MHFIKMTSVDETNGNSSSKLNDGDILNLNLECTESAKDTEHSETELLNNSFISVGEKSELYIEFEKCEELLEEEINENNEVVSINNSHELSFENNEAACINNSLELPSENNEIVSVNNSHELPFENSEVVCVNKSHASPSENNEVVCINNSHELPSDLNVLEEDGFDSEVKKCCDIFKLQEPTDPDVLSLLCESDIEASFEGELKLNGENPISDIKREKDNDKLEASYEGELKLNGENPIEKATSDIKREKDDDELSLFAETDVSTLEEFEISILECANSPLVTEVKPSMVQNDAEEDKKMVSSIVHVPETNELDNEANDINDPRWELIRILSTDQERYEQVRKCWESSTVSDPDKNLTYHSYRKRHFRNKRVIPITRKRAATSNLDVSELHPAKRQRSCTFLYDQNIDSLSEKKKKKEQNLLNQMYKEVNQLNNILYQQELRLQRQCDYYGRYNSNAYEQLYNLRKKCQREIENVQQQYTSKANNCATELQSGIQALNQARDEVLQFSKFYKGLNSNDPTVLSTFQLQELEEIENIYSQFGKLYK